MRIIFPDNRDKCPVLETIVKKFPYFVLVTSCLAPFISFFILYIFNKPGIIETFALSIKGIQQHKFWQFITYPLVTANSWCLHEPSCMEISQRLLIRNIFGFIFFYQSTEQILRKLGALSIFIFYCSQILITGALTLFVLWVIDSPKPLLGPESLVCASLLVWVFLDPEKRLSLAFFPISIPRKWGFVILLGLYFFMLMLTGASSTFFCSLFSLCLAAYFCYIKHIPNPYRNLIHY